MALRLGFRGFKFDDDSGPLFIDIGQYVYNRVTRQSLDKNSLQVAMAAAGYNPPAGEIGQLNPNWARTHIGIWTRTAPHGTGVTATLSGGPERREQPARG